MSEHIPWPVGSDVRINPTKEQIDDPVLLLRALQQREIEMLLDDDQASPAAS